MVVIKVVLLAPLHAPGGKMVQVILAAGLQIVIVVRDHAAEHAVVLQNALHRVVKGLDAAPGALQKIQASGHNVPPGGHTGR